MVVQIQTSSYKNLNKMKKQEEEDEKEEEVTGKMIEEN